MASVVVRSLHDPGRRVGLAKAVEQVSEGLAVLRHADGLKRRPQQAHVVALKDACLGQRHRKVERGLAAKPRKQAFWLFAGDDGLDGRHRERLEVHRVRHGGVGHDGGRVGVDEDGADALRPERAAGLGARVVKLRRLADDHGARTQNQDGLGLWPMRGGARDQTGGLRVSHGGPLWRSAWPHRQSGQRRPAHRAGRARPQGGTGRSRWASPRGEAPPLIGRSG